jgi:hypothetical protein
LDFAPFIQFACVDEERPFGEGGKEKIVWFSEAATKIECQVGELPNALAEFD